MFKVHLLPLFFFLWKRKKRQVKKVPKPAYGQLLGIQIQKKVISNPKQLNCKKKSAALKKAMVKKDVKSKVAAKKWL